MEGISNQTGQKGLKAVILGSTEQSEEYIYFYQCSQFITYYFQILVKELCIRSSWSQVTVIVRRSLPEWKTINGAEKIKVIEIDSLDELGEIHNWNKFAGYDSFFCTLGSRTGSGKEAFYKVDFTYCLWGAQIAELNKISHFSLLSSGLANSNSLFLYLRTKGQIEEAIKKLNIRYLSIFRPGFLKNRQNDSRFIDKFIQNFCCWFIPNIESQDCGKSMILEAENRFQNEQFEKVICYEQEQMKKLIL